MTAEETAAALPGASRKGGILLALLGFLVAGAGFITYFTVVPRYFPGLRDSGHLNVAITLLGAFVAAIGLVRCFRARRHRILGSVFLAASGLAAILLPLYVYVLTFQLPSDEGVVRSGEKAPAFELPDPEGKPRALAEFAGKKILLVFFRGAW
jgi:hypothetical protein